MRCAGTKLSENDNDKQNTESGRRVQVATMARLSERTSDDWKNSIIEADAYPPTHTEARSPVRLIHLAPPRLTWMMTLRKRSLRKRSPVAWASPGPSGAELTGAGAGGVAPSEKRSARLGGPVSTSDAAMASWRTRSSSYAKAAVASTAGERRGATSPAGGGKAERAGRLASGGAALPLPAWPSCGNSPS